MSLGFVVVLLILSPFVIGTLASLFEGNKSLTPVVINRPVYVVEDERSISDSYDVEEDNDKLQKDQLLVQSVKTKVSEEFQVEPYRLEESQEAIEILNGIIPHEDPSTLRLTNYDVSELTPELNRSLDELFAAIGSDDAVETSIAQQQELEPEFAHPQTNEDNHPLELISDMEEPHNQSIDEMIHHLYPMDTDGNVINFPSPSEHNLLISPREYRALQQKYGPDITNRITTTPALGGTGDYDCMIGKVELVTDVPVLKYRDHHIPLKGLDQEGVFLVEGMFVKPDLFFVTKYTELDSATRLTNKVAEN